MKEILICLASLRHPHSLKFQSSNWLIFKTVIQYNTWYYTEWSRTPPFLESHHCSQLLLSGGCQHSKLYAVRAPVQMRSQAQLCVSMDKQCGSAIPSAPSSQNLIDSSSSLWLPLLSEPPVNPGKQSSGAAGGTVLDQGSGAIYWDLQYKTLIIAHQKTNSGKMPEVSKNMVQYI